MDLSLARGLYIWAKRSQENEQSINDWLEESITQMAEGKGKEVSSTSANNISVQFGSNGMSNIEWFKTLTLVIQMFNNPPQTRTTAVFR